MPALFPCHFEPFTLCHSEPSEESRAAQDKLREESPLQIPLSLRVLPLKDVAISEGRAPRHSEEA